MDHSRTIAPRIIYVDCCCCCCLRGCNRCGMCIKNFRRLRCEFHACEYSVPRCRCNEDGWGRMDGVKERTLPYNKYTISFHPTTAHVCGPIEAHVCVCACTSSRVCTQYSYNVNICLDILHRPGGGGTLTRKTHVSNPCQRLGSECSARIQTQRSPLIISC